MLNFSTSKKIFIATILSKLLVFIFQKKKFTVSRNGIKYKIYLDKHWRPSVYKMINHQTGKSTDLLVQNIKFKVGLSTRDFNSKSLSRVR